MSLSVTKTEEDRKKYLIDLFETTYFKDIIEHNHLNLSESLEELCNVISDYTGNLLNSEKIANTFKSKKYQKIDKQTVERSLNFLRRHSL